MAKAMNSEGVPIRADRNEKLHHNKYAIIDGVTIITGSYNWSENAEKRNAENCLIIHDAKTASAFAADFNTHWEHSAAYDPAAGHPKRRASRPAPFFTSQKPAHEQEP